LELPFAEYQIETSDLIESQGLELWQLGWGMASYEFSRYKKSSRNEALAQLVVNTDLAKNLETKLRAQFQTRDLINIPAEDLGPQDLAHFSKELANEFSARCELIYGDELLSKNYPSIFHVGKGSMREPVLIDMSWGDSSDPLLCLVGKGVVFDSGGLNLKPESGMLLMKKDMGGAAIVLGVARMIMETRLPVRLRVLIPAVENMVSGASFRPGDVIKTRKGLSVEITNTDAEGRVVLSDALYEAVAQGPDLVIDVATLTGACRVALGSELPGCFTPNDNLAKGLEEAGRKVGDPLWRLPLWSSYKSALGSNVADLSNSAANGMGGAITAALFLQEFVGTFKNWIHLDAYGWSSEAKPGAPLGGEATGQRAIFQFLEDRYR
jgi:leucyl aminopeptidase